MATVNILVTARNQAQAAVSSVLGGFRAMSAGAGRAADQMRDRLDLTNRSIAHMSQRLTTVQGSLGGLRRASNDAADEVARLDRLVRFMGQGASDDLRNRLAQAQMAAMGARNALADAEDEARNLGRGLDYARRQATQLDRALNRLDRAQAIRNLATGVLGVARAMASGVAGLRNMVSVTGLLKVAIGAALVPVLVNAIVAIADLTGLIQLLAPAVIAGAAAVVTLKMGFHGVSDALKAGLEGDVDKFKEALKKLSPQAAGTVKALVEIGKSWRNVRRDVQDKLFHNMGRELLDLNAVIQPLAAKWLPSIAQGFNVAAKGLASLFKESAASGQLDKIMQGVEAAITGILGSITPLTQAFLDIAEVAAPSLAETGQGIAGLAEKFAAWIRQLKDNGALAEWLDRAKETLANIGDAVRTGFTAAKDAVGAMKEKFDEWGRKIAEVKETLQPMISFVKGALDDMKAAWDRNKESIQKLGDLVKILILPVLGLFAVQVGIVVVAFTALMEVIGFLGDAWGVLKDAAQKAISSMLTGLAAVLSAAASAARALGMDSLAEKLEGAAAKVRGFRDRVNDALDGIRDKTVNVTVRYREVGRSVAVGPNYETGTGGRASGGIAGGLTMVGERGMELVRLPQGSQVYSSEDTQRMLGGGRGGNTYNINLTAAPGANMAEAGKQIVEVIRAYERTSGTRWRAA